MIGKVGVGAKRADLYENQNTIYLKDRMLNFKTVKMIGHANRFFKE